MTNIVLLLVCLSAGVALRATRRVPEGAHAALNGTIINLALPALILSQLHGASLSPQLAWPVLMPWLLFLFSAVFFVSLARAWDLPRTTTGALIMTTGLGNTSFVGLPMIEAFYGRQHLATGILIDQLGTYLVLSTAGIATACLFSAGQVSWRMLAARTLSFPPLIAMLAALATNTLDYPAWLVTVLHRLGDLVAPLALVSVGLQLRLGQSVGNRLTLACGLAFKLVVGPLAMAMLYVAALHRTGDTTRVTIFEAAMGPQIGGGIVAIQYGLNSPLVTLMVGLGITLSFATLPIWYVWLAHAV